MIFAAKDPEHQLLAPVLQKKSKPREGKPDCHLLGYQQVRDQVTPRAKGKARTEEKESRSPSIRGTRFVRETDRPHWLHKEKGKPNSPARRTFMKGGQWADDAPPESAR